MSAIEGKIGCKFKLFIIILMKLEVMSCVVYSRHLIIVVMQYTVFSVMNIRADIYTLIINNCNLRLIKNYFLLKSTYTAMILAMKLSTFQ